MFEFETKKVKTEEKEEIKFERENEEINKEKLNLNEENSEQLEENERHKKDVEVGIEHKKEGGSEEEEKEENDEEIKQNEEINVKKEEEKVKTERKEKINEERNVEINDNKTPDRIKALFKSIKNFEQLKHEVYEMKKHYEYLNQLTMKNIEEKEQNNLANFNQKFSEMNKKFDLLLGDIKPKDLEGNESELQGYKAMNLSEINTRLRAYQYSKANVTDLSSLNDEFDFRIKELNRQLNEFKISILGSENETNISDNNKEQNNKQESIDNSNRREVNIPRFNFCSKNDFEKFKTKSEDEFKKIWNEINNIKFLIDEFDSKIKTKTSVDELEELKNIILQKTEELFLSQNKKYVNYASSIKILQDNFKKLLKLLSDKEQYNENNQYQMDSNPLSIGGHSCASCETYIGDLRSEQKFVSWNKFPKKEKDNGEILKRVQNGYSRLLQMINFDSKGNPSLNPYSNSINNETNISSNMEDNSNSLITKEKSDANQSFSNKRLFSTKVKKIAKENNSTLELLNSKKEYINKNKKLPSLKTSKSIDNLNRLKYKSNRNINKKDINFINPVFSQIIQDSETKNS